MVMVIFYDTHAHLDDPGFAADLPQVLERARRAGVTKIVTVGTNAAGSARALELCDQYPELYAVVGWHPTEVQEAPEDFRPALRRLAAHPKVIALGEMGLDYYRRPGGATGEGAAVEPVLRARQKRLLIQQLEVAAELGLNCVIHQREAWDDMMEVFIPFARRVRGVFHCFVGDAGMARQIIEMGSVVSFTGIVTFKQAESVRATAAAVDLGGFLLETDAPYLAPVPYRGRRCEPAYVRETAEAMARVKRCSMEELSLATCRAAEEFFSGLAR
jgi:TatD DNase family protein